MPNILYKLKYGIKENALNEVRFDYSVTLIFTEYMSAQLIKSVFH